MARISLEGMEFYSHHGYYREEQIIGTRFIIDFHFEVDTTEAQRTDELKKTVNYHTVYAMIREEMALDARLIEHVAWRILRMAHQRFPEIQSASIKISKMNPPLGGQTQKVSITLCTDDLQNQ
jgi:dihydroneopterin aldolase